MQQPRRPLFQEIKFRGLNLYRNACAYSQLHETLASTRSQLRFNLRCKKNNVLPRSLIFRPPIRSPSGWQTARVMGKRYLCDFIQDNHFRINKYNSSISSLEHDFRISIPDLIDDLNIVAKRNMDKTFFEENNRLKLKYEHLQNNQCNRYFNKNWVKNISSRVITDQETLVLGKGLKFNTKNSKNDIISLIANVDDGIDKIRNLSDEDKYSLKQRVTSSIASIHNKPNLNGEERKAMKSLQQDDSISIVPADKGNTTVIIDRSDYKNKIETHLSDISTYELVNDNI